MIRGLLRPCRAIRICRTIRISKKGGQRDGGLCRVERAMLSKQKVRLDRSVRTKIGMLLRMLYGTVTEEGTPHRFMALLARLDNEKNPKIENINFNRPRGV